MIGNNEKPSKLETVKLIGIRNVIGMHLFTLMAIGFGMRVHLSVAIESMTERQSPNQTAVVYDWQNKNIILSSFYWGYVLFQIAAAVIARYYSPKKLLVFAMTVSSAAFMAIPLAANFFDSYGVIVCRVIQGMAQGFFCPLCYIILSAWSPISERSTLAAGILNGSVFGSFAAMAAVGYACSLPVGWPITFYVHGLIGLIWVASWYFNGSSTPAEHHYISLEEIEYIHYSIGVEKDDRHKVRPKVPWKPILTSPPVWAVLICHVAHNYGFTILVTEAPNYIFKVLKYETTHDTIITSLPYNIALTIGTLCPYLADLIMVKRWIGRGLTRKIFTSIAFAIPAVTLIILSHLPNNVMAASIAMLVISFGMSSAVNGGFIVSHLDLSPNYAGILMGMGNTLANFFFIGAPQLVQSLSTNETDRSSWHIIFIITSMLYSVAAAVYISIGSSTTQWWDRIKNVKEIEAYVIPTDIIREGRQIYSERGEN